jgi:curved DNA-binding protein CbpA
MASNYYDVLCIGRMATTREIRSAYYRLALKYHPDKNPGDLTAQERFIAISNAYRVLSDKSLRRRYDLSLESGSSFPQQTESGHAARRRPPPPEYYRRRYQETVEYSRRTYVYGALFGLLLIALVTLIPYFLLRTSSSRHYELAWGNYRHRQYPAALENIRYAIRDFGNRNAEACLLAGMILTDHLPRYDQALRFLNRGLDFNPDDSVAASLHYVRGRCLQLLHRYEEAVASFSSVGNIAPFGDSALFRQALVLGLVLEEHHRAIAILRGLVIRQPGFDEARYFMAYSLAESGRTEEALGEYALLVRRHFEVAACEYHMGRIQLQLGKIADACGHLRTAAELQLPEAIDLYERHCVADSLIR